jgi:hypothetical protein
MALQTQEWINHLMHLMFVVRGPASLVQEKSCPEQRMKLLLSVLPLVHMYRASSVELAYTRKLCSLTC